MNEENKEVVMENVTPEDLKTDRQTPDFVPSPPWKRALAWVLFGVVAVGIGFWLLGIARPEWTSEAANWLKELLGH